jgi:hypothetical protein
MDDGLSQTKCGVFKNKTKVKGCLVSQPQVGSSGTPFLVLCRQLTWREMSIAVVIAVQHLYCSARFKTCPGIVPSAYLA